MLPLLHRRATSLCGSFWALTGLEVTNEIFLLQLFQAWPQFLENGLRHFQFISKQVWQQLPLPFLVLLVAPLFSRSVWSWRQGTISKAPSHFSHITSPFPYFCAYSPVPSALHFDSFPQSLFKSFLCLETFNDFQVLWIKKNRPHSSS